MDNEGPKGDLGLVRVRASVSMEEYVPSHEFEQEVGLSPTERRSLDAHSKSVWRFLINWPVVPVPPLISPRSLAPRSSRHPSEKLLSKVEVEWTHPIIIVRKILQDRPVEYMMIGNLH